MEDRDTAYMKIALDQAAVSKRNGDVPFGAVIIRDDEILAAMGNSEQVDQDVTRHAEVKAVSSASRLLGSRDLSGCTIYSTMEPCPMCATAIFYAGIDRVVYAISRDDLPHLFRSRNVRLHHLAQDWNYGPKVMGGVLKNQAIEIFLDYKQPFRLSLETNCLPDSCAGQISPA